MVGTLNRDCVMPPHSIRFDDIIFKRYAFRVVLLEPAVRSKLIGKDLEVIGVSNFLDVNPNGCHWRFNAFMTPMRANIAGPSCSATSNSTCIAACQASCSALGKS